MKDGQTISRISNMDPISKNLQQAPLHILLIYIWLFYFTIPTIANDGLSDICAQAKVLGIPYREVQLDWIERKPDQDISQGKSIKQSRNVTGPTGYGIEVRLEDYTFAMKLQPNMKATFVRASKKICDISKIIDQEDCKNEVYYGGMYPKDDMQHDPKQVLTWPAENMSYVDKLAPKISLEAIGLDETTPKDIDIPDYPFQREIIAKDDKKSKAERFPHKATDLTAVIGLNRESYLIKALRDSNRITSKVWSFFPGWKGLAEVLGRQRDGMLVFGGYDASKVNGSFLQFPIPQNSDACQLPLKVKEMKFFGVRISPQITYNPGSLEKIEENRPAEFEACIDPQIDGIMMGIWGIGMASDIFYQKLFAKDKTKFETLLPSDLKDFSGFRARKSLINAALRALKLDRNDAGIEIFVEGGKLSIPIHQIFQPAKNLTALGYDLDNDYEEILFPVHNPKYDNLVRLGTQFLAGSYLVANYDNDTFSLAQIPSDIPADAIPTLVPIIESHICNASTSRDTYPPEEAPPADKTTIIAGATIGGIAILLILTGVIIFFRRRRLRDPPLIPVSETVRKDDLTRQSYQLPGDTRVQEAHSSIIHQKGDNDVPRDTEHRRAVAEGSRHELPV